MVVLERAGSRQGARCEILAQIVRRRDERARGRPGGADARKARPARSGRVSPTPTCPSMLLAIINAHGTGTVANDITEIKAIKNSIRRRGQAPCRSPRRNQCMEHALGASGSLELIAVIEAIRRGIVPPTINIEELDPECDPRRRRPVVRGHVRSGPLLAMPSHSAGPMRSSR